MDLTALPSILLTIVIVIPLLWIVGFVIFHSTEILKLLTRWVASIPALNWVAIRGYGSYITALILAAVAVFLPGTGLADPLSKIFTALGFAVNPVFVNILTTFLVSLIAAAQADSGKMPTPLKK